MNENIKTWSNNRQIAATIYLTSDDINTLCAIQLYSNRLICVDTLYELLAIKKEVYDKLTKILCNDVLKSVITYLQISLKITPEHTERLLLFFDLAKNFPCGIDQLSLSGTDIIKMLKCDGIKVGTIKEKLLECVFRGELKNDKDELINYVKKLK